MKRSGLTLRLASATLFLTVVPAWSLDAQDAPAMGMAAKTSKRADELLKRYDKNGDGKIDDDERADAKEWMMKEQIERQMVRSAAIPGGSEAFRTPTLELFDKNRDGRIDEQERAAIQKFVEVRDEAAIHAARLLKQFDRNGDGALDAAEQAMVDTFVAELRSAATSHVRAGLLRMFDQNSDGKINDDEFVELEKFVRPRIEASVVQMRRHDSNGDGRLDDTEWATARQAILQWLNASGPAALANDSTLLVPADKQKQVEVELMRRRTESQRKSGTTEASATPRSPESEAARLRAVAAEVGRRREEREAAARQPAK